MLEQRLTERGVSRRSFMRFCGDGRDGLADLLGAARLSGAFPQELVLHGAQPGSTVVGTDITAPVAARIDPLVDRIAAELAAPMPAA